MKVSDVSSSTPADQPATALRQEATSTRSPPGSRGSAALVRVPGLSGRRRRLRDLLRSRRDPDQRAHREKAEELRRFMVAFAEAHQWLRQNFDAAAEINMRWIPGVDLDVMKIAIRRRLRSPDPRTRSRATTRRPSHLVAGGKVKQAFDPSPSSTRSSTSTSRRPRRSSSPICRSSRTAGSDPEGRLAPRGPAHAQDKIRPRPRHRVLQRGPGGAPRRSSPDARRPRERVPVRRRPSGCGKSTLIAAIAGFLKPARRQSSR